MTSMPQDEPRYGEGPRLAVFRHTTDNVGDDIQTLAVCAIVGQPDLWIDRDDPHLPVGEEPATLICNGWLTHRPDRWPPDPRLEAVVTSVHLACPEQGRGSRWRRRVQGLPDLTWPRRREVRAWLDAHGPVGARDTWSLDLLQDLGIDSRYTGCVTLTLDREDWAEGRRGDEVVLVDVPDRIAVAAADATDRPVGIETHLIDPRTPRQERHRQARRLLVRYAGAAAVITSRLHSALPCVALGTPVVLLRTDTAEAERRMSDSAPLLEHLSLTEAEVLVRDGGLDDPTRWQLAARPPTAETLRRSLAQLVSAR